MKYLFILLLTGCTVNNDAIEIATKHCVDYGGIDYIEGSMAANNRVSVRCTNGLTLNIPRPKEGE